MFRCQPHCFGFSGCYRSASLGDVGIVVQKKGSSHLHGQHCDYFAVSRQIFGIHGAIQWQGVFG